MIPSTAYARAQREFRGNLQTTNVDAQDHSTEVPALFEQTVPVEAQLESVAIQAVTTGIARATQCKVDQHSAAGTQYEPQLMGEERLQEVVMSKEYRQFFDRGMPLLKSALISNHVGDSQFALAADEEEYDAKGQSTLAEIQNLQNQVYTKDRTVTCLSYYQYGKMTLVFQGVAPPGFINQQQKSSQDDRLGKYYVLIWNIADNTQPVGFLVAPAAATAIDISEFKGHLLVSVGTISGQLLIYDLDGVYKNLYESATHSSGIRVSYNAQNQITFSTALERVGAAPPEFYPSIQTSPVHFHSMAVTDTKWLPHDSQITRSGELQTSASPYGGTQLVSVSPDGYVKVYSLLCFDRDSTRLDLMVIVPFLTVPCAVIFPSVRKIKPVTIQFSRVADNPSSIFIIGDVFGNVCFSTWSVAVAGAYALDDERKKIEKQLLRDMGDGVKQNIEKLETYAVDKPSRGTLITGFQFFLGTVFHLEYSQTLPGLLVSAATDGVKMWLTERKIHRQTSQYSMRGLVEEQLILQQSPGVGPEVGLTVVKQLPPKEIEFKSQAQQSGEAGGMGIGIQGNQNAGQLSYKQLITPRGPFVDLPQLLGQLNLSLINMGQHQQGGMQALDINVQDIAKRVPNINQAVARQFETDFPNYDFYMPVFNFLPKDEQLTGACMSGSAPSVLFLATDRGSVLVFDLNDRMYEPLIRVVVCQGQAITRLQYIKQAVMGGGGGPQGISAAAGAGGENTFQLLPEKKKIKMKDVLLVSDAGGNVHVYEIPRLLRHRRDAAVLRNKFRKGLEAGEYVAYRQAIRRQSRMECSKDAEGAGAADL